MIQTRFDDNDPLQRILAELQALRDQVKDVQVMIARLEAELRGLPRYQRWRWTGW